MERFIRLNLTNDNQPVTNATSQQTQYRDPEVSAKKLNLIANKAAHKAASIYSRSGTGIFSK